MIIGLVGMNRMSIAAMCPAESYTFTGNKRVAFLSKVLGGHFRMPFSLWGAPATFERVLTSILFAELNEK